MNPANTRRQALAALVSLALAGMAGSAWAGETEQAAAPEAEPVELTTAATFSSSWAIEDMSAFTTSRPCASTNA